MGGRGAGGRLGGVLAGEGGGRGVGERWGLGGGGGMGDRRGGEVWMGEGRGKGRLPSVATSRSQKARARALRLLHSGNIFTGVTGDMEICIQTFESLLPFALLPTPCPFSLPLAPSPLLHFPSPFALSFFTFSSPSPSTLSSFVGREPLVRFHSRVLKYNLEE